jgi:fengycin family lipopeptide synthetase D
LPDGNLEFLGRLDHQVKIRGFRIELSEIEARLAAHPRIKAAVVAARHDGADDHYLTAYIVFSPAGTLDKLPGSLELRNYLSDYLPDYMIPAYFVPSEQIPVTANGKLDRKALPAPTRGLDSGIQYEAPTDEVEEKLVKIWKDILQLEKIGINDNFFQLGGHSLRAMTLVNEIHRAFEVELPIRLIFDHPIIAEIAGQIRVEEEQMQKLYRILGEIETLTG